MLTRPVLPRDSLYFLRLSGKNPGNGAGRAGQILRFRRNTRGGIVLTTVSLPTFQILIFRSRHVFVQRSSTIDRYDRFLRTRSFPVVTEFLDFVRALVVGRPSHCFHPYTYTVCRYIVSYRSELEASNRRKPKGYSLAFDWNESVKSAVSFARVLLQGAEARRGSGARISAVGGRDPGAEVARKQERAGRTGGYCLLGDLSSNTSRQATRPGHQAWGQTRAFYPYPWGQPLAPVEIKNSLYYTSHSVLPPSPWLPLLSRPPLPPPRPPARPRQNRLYDPPLSFPLFRARLSAATAPLSAPLSRHILAAAPAAPRSPRTDLI